MGFNSGFKGLNVHFQSYTSNKKFTKISCVFKKYKTKLSKHHKGAISYPFCQLFD